MTSAPLQIAYAAARRGDAKVMDAMLTMAQARITTADRPHIARFATTAHGRTADPLFDDIAARHLPTKVRAWERDGLKPIAASRGLGPRTAEVLARCGDNDLVAALALNPATPSATLRGIAQRRYRSTIGGNALRNPNLDDETRIALWEQRWADRIPFSDIVTSSAALSARALRSRPYLTGLGVTTPVVKWLSPHLADRELLDAIAAGTIDTGNATVADDAVEVLRRDWTRFAERHFPVYGRPAGSIELAVAVAARIRLLGGTWNPPLPGAERVGKHVTTTNAPQAALDRALALGVDRVGRTCVDRALTGTTKGAHLDAAIAELEAAWDAVGFATSDDEAARETALAQARWRTAAHIAANPALDAARALRVAPLLGTGETGGQNGVGPGILARFHAEPAIRTLLLGQVSFVTFADEIEENLDRNETAPAWLEAAYRDAEIVASTMAISDAVPAGIWARWLQRTLPHHPDLVGAAAATIRNDHPIDGRVAAALAESLAQLTPEALAILADVGAGRSGVITANAEIAARIA